jgi:hypothetical protein
MINWPVLIEIILLENFDQFLEKKLSHLEIMISWKETLESWRFPLDQQNRKRTT